MTYVKYAVWAVVAFFLFRLYRAKQAGQSTPDALRSQIPIVGGFLGGLAERPATVATGAGTAALDVQAYAPGQIMIRQLDADESPTIMLPAPSPFLGRQEPHPVILNDFSGNSFFGAKSTAPRPPTLSLTLDKPQVQGFTATGGATKASAPIAVAAPSQRARFTGPGSLTDSSAPSNWLAPTGRGFFG